MIKILAKEFKYHESCYKEFTRKKKKTPSLSQKEKDAPRYSLDGNFEAVRECIEEKILKENQAVSMKVVHDIFGLETEDTRYRSKLKSRIKTTFPSKLYFLTVNSNIPEVVINASAIDSHITFNDHSHIIQQAARYLREDILEYVSTKPELTWPISLEEVSSDSRQPPESVLEFLSCLLKNKDHPNREVVNRLIQSYAADLLHGVTCGRFITSKHFLLGLGLHNITGQKKPVQIASQLGHSIDYNLVCEIETAQAEASQLLSTISGTLPVKPRTSNGTVLTFFWVDNFDLNIETQTGHGAINSTHMIAFQEEEAVTIQEELSLQNERKKSRTLSTPPTHLRSAVKE